MRHLLFGVVTLTGVALAHCAPPTQVRVSFSTNAAADKPKLAVFASADPLETEVQLRALQLTADMVSTCTIEGDRCVFGTIVTSPGNGDRGAVAALVALGKKTLEQCAKAPEQEGCIIARRRFGYQSGTTLNFEIQLDLDCQNQACDAYNTCSKGTCIGSEVRCQGASCSVNPDAGLTIVQGYDSGLARDSGGLLIDAGVTPTDGGALFDAAPPREDSGLPIDAGVGRDATVALDATVAVGMCPLNEACPTAAGGPGGAGGAVQVCEGTQVCCVAPMAQGGEKGCGTTATCQGVYGCCSKDAPCGGGFECCVGGTSACTPVGKCVADSIGCNRDEDCSPAAPVCRQRPPGAYFGFLGTCSLQ